MQKFVKPAVFVGISLAIFFILRTAFPKNAGVILFLFTGLLLDLYLWNWVKKKIRTRTSFYQRFWTAVYWMPFTLLIILVAYGLVVPLMEWNQALKSYLPGFLLILYFSKMFPILGLLVADLSGVSILLFHRLFCPIPENTVPFRRNSMVVFCGGIAGGILFLLLLSGIFFWQFDFRVRREIVQLKDLPPSFDGMKMVQLSDIHLGSWPSKVQLEKAVSMVNALQPDIVVFTGDLFNYGTSDGNGFETILMKLHAPEGIYAILGNHDYGDYVSWHSPEAKRKNMEELFLYFKKLGWHLLRNENVILKNGMDSIALIGVENWGATQRFQRLGDIRKAEKGTEGMSTRVLLSHDPTHWGSIISRQYQDIDLTLSGHTHGGQLGIDCCGIHWSPAGWIYPEWCGLYSNPDSPSPQYLYVNQGLGNIGYSGRVGILPEITLITLKRAK